MHTQHALDGGIMQSTIHTVHFIASPLSLKGKKQLYRLPIPRHDLEFTSFISGKRLDLLGRQAEFFEFAAAIGRSRRYRARPVTRGVDQFFLAAPLMASKNAASRARRT